MSSLAAKLDYCKELGVSVELFVKWSDWNYMWEADPERGPLAGRRVRLREVEADLLGSTNELLAKATDPRKRLAEVEVEFEVWQGVGHLPWIDDPVRLQHSLRDFL